MPFFFESEEQEKNTGVTETPDEKQNEEPTTSNETVEDDKSKEEATEEQTPEKDTVEEPEQKAGQTEPAEEKSEDDFSQMLEETFVDTDTIVEGDVVEGKVVGINENYIFVSLGGKNEAYAEREDFQTKTGKLKVAIGDVIKGFVVKKTDSEIVISKSLNRKYVDKGFLKEAYDNKIPVNGKIVSLVKGGFSVEILGTRAFCPFSLADVRYIANPQEMIGNYYDFEIAEISSDMRNIVLSRKSLLMKEMEEARKTVMENLNVGDVVTGKVSRIASFGAFVDLGGIDGLLHISQLSWVKVDTPHDVVKPGDEIEVKVIAIDGNKISLSMKELVQDPMIQALEEINEGDVVSCRILRNESFGSFCEIKPGVEGLIPISEMLLNSRVMDPSEVVNVGDLVEAQIIRINRPEKKISLSLKALQEDPWEHIEEHVKEEDIVEGVIESITNFGIFIRIQVGLTGLLPKSKMARSKTNYTEEDINKKVAIRVSQVDTSRKRISLEPLDVEPAPAGSGGGGYGGGSGYGGGGGSDYYQDSPRPRGERKQPKSDWRQYTPSKQEVPEDNPFSKL
jgi:small subunit ribosomal protein S1